MNSWSIQSSSFVAAAWRPRPPRFCARYSRDRLALDVAAVRQRDDHVLRRDEVLVAHVERVHHDLAAPRVAELVADRRQLVADDRGDALGLREDVEQVGDLAHHVAVLVDDLVLLEPGEALQAHLQDLLRLVVRQPVQAVGLHAVVGRQPVGSERVAAAGRVGLGAREHLAHERRVPRTPHQLLLRDRRRRRGLDQRDELVDVRERDREAFEHVAAFARLLELEHGPSRDDLASMRDERLDHRLQVAQPRLTVDQRDHVHAERVLQLRVLVEVVQHDLGNLAALELDDDAHARLVGLVLDVRDALELLLLRQLGDALEQRLLVHLVRQLVDDDRRAVAALDVLEVDLRAHHDAAAAGAIALADAGDAVDDPAGREVGRGHDLDQLVDRAVGVAQHVQARVDRLAQVVRRDVRRHADRDAGRAVDEQVRQPRRQDERLLLGAVVVRAEVDRLAIEVREHLVRDLREADLGVAHRRGVVAVDRAEVALAVDQHVAQREVLRHPHDRVVDRGVAVRVVLADHVADDAGRLLVRPVPVVVELVHRVQHAPVHRLQSVAGVGQRAPDDHAHRVVEIRPAHLLFETDRDHFLGERIHADRSWKSGPERSDRRSRRAERGPATGPRRSSSRRDDGDIRGDDGTRRRTTRHPTIGAARRREARSKSMRF